jgi:tRNA dimethylallyltransferase
MRRDPFRNAVILTGPTGAGKTEVALELAERLGAEIVSMDSMAIYRGMDIGTAKPSLESRKRVPHHLIDELDPWQEASVAWWLKRAQQCCLEIKGRGKRPLVVGGTPLYLKALLHGLFDGPPGDVGLRSKLSAEAEQNGRQALHDRLTRVDPTTAARLHPNDLRRVIRALEVWELTGRPISEWQTQWNGGSGTRTHQSSRPAPQCFYLDLPRAELYGRIDARVKQMFASGLVEEVRSLRRLPFPVSRGAAQALGYKEVFEFLDGLCSLEETVVRIQTRSRNFAKRQLSWFRHLPECRAVTIHSLVTVGMPSLHPHQCLPDPHLSTEILEEDR